jgi:hypothetical protein
MDSGIDTSAICAFVHSCIRAFEHRASTHPSDSSTGPSVLHLSTIHPSSGSSIRLFVHLPARPSTPQPSQQTPKTFKGFQGYDTERNRLLVLTRTLYAARTLCPRTKAVCRADGSTTTEDKHTTTTNNHQQPPTTTNNHQQPTTTDNHQPPAPTYNHNNHHPPATHTTPQRGRTKPKGKEKEKEKRNHRLVALTQTIIKYCTTNADTLYGLVWE